MIVNSSVVKLSALSILSGRGRVSGEETCLYYLNLQVYVTGYGVSIFIQLGRILAMPVLWTYSSTEWKILFVKSLKSDFSRLKEIL